MPEALKQVFEIATGRLDRLFVSGGAHCAWIAAVAHWIFDLSVEVRDPDGDVIYRPGGATNESSIDSQVTITYSNMQARHSMQVTGKHHVIPSGSRLIIGDTTYRFNGLSYGRVAWQNCLVDTFGSPMRLLQESQARTTGICLGSAARIFLGNMRDGEYEISGIEWKNIRRASPPVSSSSFGRGFYLFSLQLLPELNQNPVIQQAMETSLNRGYVEAAQQYPQSIAILSNLCSCFGCNSSADNRGPEASGFCLMALIQTICTIVRAMSVINMKDGLEIQPCRLGLEKLYTIQNEVIVKPSTYDRGATDDYGEYTDDPVNNGLLRSWPPNGILQLSQVLFTGRESIFAKQHEPSTGMGVASIGGAVAVSHHGLCFCLDTLTRITSDPEQACRVTVVPGRIEWNGFVYDSVRDRALHLGQEGRDEVPYEAASITDISLYEDLVDSSSADLKAELVVEETITETKGLHATYRVKTPVHQNHYFAVGPSEVWRQLNKAFTASSCFGKACKSLNGVRSRLVTGEGLLPPDIRWLDPLLPVIRVLSFQDLAIWVAITQERPQMAEKPMETMKRKILSFVYA
ncbi:hypothetical protein FLONG3_5156 [Fusarium longipes]|uniref:Uncharacterized protein n=1 Tax=Fusarium longipes TaxID=694270 RepID=A0A395SWX4_9HYPO|nr:hypothetical protein FLONG3_5156 [Fusarium longipes]